MRLLTPGNSGGALLNMQGEVIGINAAKYADTDVEGIGYAIPISFAKDIIDDLMTKTTKIAVDEEEQGYPESSCRISTAEWRRLTACRKESMFIRL